MRTKTLNRPQFTALLFSLLMATLITDVHSQTPAHYEQARKKLVDETVVNAGVSDPRVLDSLRKTPRHEFVAPIHRKNAYYDMALPIGDKQTISSPFIVGYMTQVLEPKETDRVLEIGTGSGYQAAILSPLVKEVYSIEIVESLGKHARKTLDELKYKNIFTKIGDGFKGWEEYAPFDKIIVTCSPENVPQPLVDQLKEGGLMVIPVGERYQQTLTLMRKKEGQLIAEALRPTLFVPMTGRAEDNRRVKPDPLNPKIVNGNFEEDTGNLKYIPGWYYEEQASRESDNKSPEGTHFVQFVNSTLGRRSQILQGFPISGNAIHQIELSAAVKSVNVIGTGQPDEAANIAISFYDENRKELHRHWVGPFLGTEDWHVKKSTVQVPKLAREAIVRIGLFGSTGTLCVDNVQLRVVK